MNVITQQEFELTYYEVTVQHVNQYATGTPLWIFCKENEMNEKLFKYSKHLGIFLKSKNITISSENGPLKKIILLLFLKESGILTTYVIIKQNLYTHIPLPTCIYMYESQLKSSWPNQDTLMESDQMRFIVQQSLPCSPHSFSILDPIGQKSH